MDVLSTDNRLVDSCSLLLLMLIVSDWHDLLYQVVNFSGPAAIVVVSCVTKDKPYCPHPHNLVGQDCRDGVCTVKVKGRNTVS